MVDRRRWNLPFKEKGRRKRNEKTRKREVTNAFSNGINVLLITRPERKIYLLSPRICDQGISVSVLLRDENWKYQRVETMEGEEKRNEIVWDGEREPYKCRTREGEHESPLAMETFSWFQCEADLKFISLFKGLFFCSRSRVFIFFFFFLRRTMTRRRRNPVFSLPRQLEHLLLSCSRIEGRGSFNFTWLHIVLSRLYLHDKKRKNRERFSRIPFPVSSSVLCAS